MKIENVKTINRVTAIVLYPIKVTIEVDSTIDNAELRKKLIDEADALLYNGEYTTETSFVMEEARIKDWEANEIK